MKPYRYDEHGHLLTLHHWEGYGYYFGHVHEDQALECAVRERNAR